MLRQLNQSRVLSELRNAGALRLVEVAQRSHLSRPTVTQVLEELHQAGWVTYLDQHASGYAGLGRPGRLVRFRAEAGYVVGIDIGPHRMNVIVADLDGKPVAVSRHSTATAQDGALLLALVRSAIRNALHEAHVPRQAVLSVAAGSPGIIDPDTGAVILAPSVPGWSSRHLGQELQRSFRCPVRIDNDVNLAVLGERWRGAAQEAQTVVFVQWGERIGAGICIGGQVHRGAANGAGEIGYLSVLGDDPLNGSLTDAEGRGLFEREAGAAAITRLGEEMARRRGGRLAEVLDETGALDAAAVFAAAEQGDTGAREVVDIVLDRFARGLAALLLILDPDMLVVGGGISGAGGPMLSAVKERLAHLVLVTSEVKLSMLGEEAAAWGAVRLALTDVEQRVLP